MKRTVAKRAAGLIVAGAALLAASPAVASSMGAYSPGGKAYAYSYGTNTIVAIKQNADGKSYAAYKRAAGGGDTYHAWNKSGPGTTEYSDPGSTVTQLRACNWIPDNDDECGSWSYRQ
ncbi:hypothetical protein [Streptomyces sp. UNOC14_S4]|uniref:hypothetical protein n=1 Tax=Streptomyces sp. UNOC14_S4 TaxID=2872340 RepID=UPI001E3932D1|nr:hypothetical protein [Streptomyces sp. UNOC14_S4]MCC3768208.1 hypothetical protein [Streptomyces sp. UNOC14_S4]